MGVYLESDGKAVSVTLSYTTGAKEPGYVQGWLGIVEESGDSGDSVALTIDRREYQFKVPAALNVSKGDTVYVTLASVTAHEIDDDAYTLTGGAGTLALFKATSDEWTTGGETWVTGILLGGLS